MIDTGAGTFRGAPRRELVLDSHLNGLDAVELDPERPATLLLRFLEPVPPDAYGLRERPDRIAIAGGIRVTGLRAVAVRRVGGSRHGRGEAHLRVTLDRAGDRSVYTVQVDLPELDPCFRRADFTFVRDPVLEADCRPAPSPPPPAPPGPALDYLAKDYLSFRQALIDLVPQLNPGWLERSPADLGITVLELLAYAGDQLSYLQDAVGNEAYLDRARLRTSVRRHARLLDYRMHDGRNAWTWVRFAVTAPGLVPAGTRLVTRIAAPLAGDVAAPGTVIPDAAGSRVGATALETDPALAGAVVFETVRAQPVDPLNEDLRLHDWGVAGSVLAAGATSAFVYAIEPSGRAVRPPLHAGDWLLLEDAGDATHRQVVLLEAEPVPVEDAVFSAATVNGNLQLAGCPGAREAGPLPLLLLSWRASDAVVAPFPISAPADASGGCPPAAAPGPAPLSVARGNVAAADHGVTTTEALSRPALALGHAPLTMACPGDLACDVHAAVPAITVEAGGATWTPAPDLLESGPFDRRFVADVDDAGVASLRFGDGVLGAALPDGPVTATYRVGNGRAGNAGAGSIAHVVVSDAGQPWVDGVAVTNPLPARGGADPETADDVRGRAPQVARTQERAVTEADYRAAALAVPGVAAAAASLRWTGTWQTAFVGIQPADPGQLVTGRDGGLLLAGDLAAAVAEMLERRRLAGCDVEIRAPRYVGLDVALTVTIAPGHFRADVLAEVAGAIDGLFGPSSAYTFGTPVRLPDLYRAALAVEGVAGVAAERFRPYGRPPAGELQAAVVTLGAFDVARLENDPRRPELGVLHLDAVGGGA